MDLGLQGRTAVIIGGANGIGRATAEAFAAEGASVVIADVSPRTADVAAEMHVFGMTADAANYADMQRVGAETYARFGRCDHVVYAAGLGSGKFGFPFWNLEPADWGRVLSVTLMGAVNAAHAFAPAMAEDRFGTFLFISSVAGQIGSQTDPPYSASKAALINFAQCAAKDLAPYGVRVNTLCPGMVQTDLNRAVWQAWQDRQPPEQSKSYEEWAEEKVRAVAPLGRWQAPEEMAAMAVFLASHHAANITGQTINVDGGQVMHW
jgi:2-hydroxycyclohexanecarboxyl-CoA dehydrogenase